MKQTTKRRSRWLGPIQALLIVMLAGDVLSIPLILFGHGAPEVASVGVFTIFSGDSYVHRHFTMLGLSTVTVIEDSPSLTEDVLYSLGAGLAFSLVSIPLILAALNVIADARTGDPFTRLMVRRLRRLGLMVLILGLFSEVVEVVAQLILLRISLPDDPTLRPFASILHLPSFWWVLPGLVLLAMAAVVDRGCDLRDQVDGLV